MAATIAQTQMANLPSTNTRDVGSNADAGAQDLADAQHEGAAPLPHTHKFNLHDFKLVRTLGTGKSFPSSLSYALQDPRADQTLCEQGHLLESV